MMSKSDYHLDDTIVAVASPKGGAARGIVRLSGSRTLEIVERIFDAERPLSMQSPSTTSGQLKLIDTRISSGPFHPHCSRPGSALRFTTFATVSNTLEGRPLLVPAELYLWPTARSYTGGQVAEFHTMGSAPLLDVAVRACCQYGARLAEPGEFTLRAFLAGRIDLTQAEAVAGIIDADDTNELDAALDQLAGGLARPLQTLRSTMLELLAHLEAGFDYADEDLSFITDEALFAGLQQCVKETDALLVQLQRRADTGDLVRVGLFGRPNVGKSSLFNTMTGDARAIVSHHPGTTRDYLTATLDIDGIRFEMIDTAGVDPEQVPDATPDRTARQVSAAQAERVNLRLTCLDASAAFLLPRNLVETPSFDRSSSCSRAEEIFVITKTDTLDVDARRDVEQQCQAALGSGSVRLIFTSTVTHEGVKQLLLQVSEAVLSIASPGGTAVATTAARCEASLREADESLRRALSLAESSLGEELIAAELRLALESIGKVAGTVYTEEILEQVFQRFCVGK